jgi:hypothetical protein
MIPVFGQYITVSALGQATTGLGSIILTTIIKHTISVNYF